MQRLAHDELDAMFRTEFANRSGVGGCHVDSWYVGGNTGIARRAHDGGDRRILEEGSDQGVLAGTAT